MALTFSFDFSRSEMACFDFPRSEIASFDFPGSEMACFNFSPFDLGIFFVDEVDFLSNALTFFTHES